MSLFSSLHTASTALNVFSRALGAEQTNIANASTPGYAAQKATVLPIDLSGTGASSGDFLVLSSNTNVRTDAAVQAASSQASASQSQAQQLEPVNQLFDITGTSGILAALQQFGAAFSKLSVTPNDTTLAAGALSAAGTVASAFRTVAASLDRQKTQVDGGIQSATSQINALAANIRQLNVRANGSGQNDPGRDASLRSNLDQLSALVDITVSTDANGSVSVLVGGQLPLVIGNQAYKLSVNPAAPVGSQVASSAGGTSPASFSGQLGALLETRTGAIAQLLGANGASGTLNTLAAGFASRVNELLSSGVSASGVPGVAIFSFDTADLSNAARTLALDSSVAPDQLGLATTGATPEANGIANQLAALVGSNNAADQIGGLSALDLFGSIAASIGQQLADARNAASADQTALTAVQANRQQQTGVSLDQEAVAITAWQRAYEASARVFSILNELTGDEVNLIK
jgi:flagellar hook-associated protein 1 FlgK